MPSGALTPVTMVMLDGNKLLKTEQYTRQIENTHINMHIIMRNRKEKYLSAQPDCSLMVGALGRERNC